ncbi:acyltransferase [Dactylosporangium sp. NPDC051485]|uniref:acyltransferase family protein n=1 Tax=Dactylosporangium sp. NPDC051485 TaxID=3154846 RepID=UPI003444A50A
MTVDTMPGRAVARAGSRSPAIDGIRGVAALALLTVHVAMFSGLMGTRAFGEPRPPSNWLGSFFVSGMPSFIGVFFVLPAMFLYLPLARATIAGTPRPRQAGGLARRLLRLLPGYYAMVLIALVALNRDQITGIWYVLRPLLLLQIYSPTPLKPNFINGLEISWTVPSMVQWYLLLPLIWWAGHRFAARGTTPAARARRLLLPVPLLVAAGVAWLLLVKANGWDNRMVFWWPQGFAPTIGIGLALAVLIALSQVSPADTPRLLRAAASRPMLFWGLAFVVYLVNCVRPFSVIGMDAIYSTSGLLVTYVMVALFGLFASLPLVAPGARHTVVSAVLGAPPLAFVGKVSYGIYLWHFAVMHFWLQAGNVVTGHTRPLRELYGVAGFVELETVTVIGAVLFATISYYVIERPAAALGERFLLARGTVSREAARRPVAAVAAPARAKPAVTGPLAGEVAAMLAQRDAIQTNLLDLERATGRYLTGRPLTGETRRRWATGSTDLAALWELYTAYSAVAEAAHGLADAAEVERLLHTDSVVVTEVRPPLYERHVTDAGLSTCTVPAAVDRMDELFLSVAGLVGTVERIAEEAGAEFGRLTAEIAGIAAGAGAAAEEQLHLVRRLLETDPLALADGTVLEELRRRVAAAH